MALSVKKLQAQFDKRFAEGTITAGFITLLIYHTRHYYDRYTKTFDNFQDSRWELFELINSGDDTTDAKEHFEAMCDALDESLRKCRTMRLMTEDATLSLENPSEATLKAYAQAMVDTYDEDFEDAELEDGMRDEARCGKDPVATLGSFGELYEQIHNHYPPEVDWNN